jgi:hypothetical protein
MIVKNQYYNSWNYFWVPGALKDFDIPDLDRLVSPKNQLWIDPVDQLGTILDPSKASSVLGAQKNLQIIIRQNKTTDEAVKIFSGTFM